MQFIRSLFKLLFTLSLLVLTAASITGAAYFGGLLPERVHEVEKLVHVERPQPTLDELLEIVPPQYGVAPLLARAIINRESGGRMDAVRFEPTHWDRALKAAPKGTPRDTVRLYASSICALQVMGWHAPRFGFSPVDLFNPQNCFDAGMAILKDCMDRHSGKTRAAQIRSALTCYNGSTEYADEVMQTLGQMLIDRDL